ncbi:hypothetical protein LTR78_010192 [Recurvomyces mirabilis]|uniref:Uncharacterized protein n=1 Tax=Recurvomyces mirabilis TaxID=574656 RepID=A0AAE0TQ54_9PEZI|nr:hypothetical protein LTR78_010192 [Recurvomyces mirabilis]KAK5149721.1 hypothetical protein LTS14_010719 [Recurvomyces mirabilis]
MPVPRPKYAWARNYQALHVGKQNLQEHGVATDEARAYKKWLVDFTILVQQIRTSKFKSILADGAFIQSIDGLYEAVTGDERTSRMSALELQAVTDASDLKRIRGERQQRAEEVLEKTDQLEKAARQSQTDLKKIEDLRRDRDHHRETLAKLRAELDLAKKDMEAAGKQHETDLRRIKRAFAEDRDADRAYLRTKDDEFAALEERYEAGQARMESAYADRDKMADLVQEKETELESVTKLSIVHANEARAAEGTRDRALKLVRETCQQASTDLDNVRAACETAREEALLQQKQAAHAVFEPHVKAAERLRRENTTLTIEKADVVAEVAKLTDELAKLVEEKDQLAKANDELAKANVDYGEAFEALRDNEARHTVALQKARDELAKTHAQLNGVSQHEFQLTLKMGRRGREVQAAKRYISSMQGDLEAKEREYDVVTAALERSRQSVASAGQTVDDLRLRIARYQSTDCDLRQCNESQRKDIINKTAEMSLLQVANDGFQAEVVEAKRTTQELQVCLSQAQEVSEREMQAKAGFQRMHTLEQERCRGLQEKLDKAEGTCKELETSLSSEQEACRVTRSSLDEAEKGKIGMQKKLDEVNQQYIDLQARFAGEEAKCRDIEEELDEVKQKCGDLQARFAGEEAKCKGMEEELDKAGRFNAEVQEKLDEVKQKCGDLQTGLGDEQEKCGGMKKELKEAERTKDDMQKKLDEVKQKCSGFESSLAAEVAMQKGLREKFDMAQSSNNNLQRSQSQAEHKSKGLQENLNQATQSHTRLRKQFEAEMQKNVDLQDALDAAHEGTGTLQLQLEKTAKHSKNLQSTVDSAVAKNSDLQKDLQRAVEGRNALSLDVEKMKGLQQQLDAATSSTNQLMQTVDQNKGALATANKQLKELTIENANLDQCHAEWEALFDGELTHIQPFVKRIRPDVELTVRPDLELVFADANEYMNRLEDAKKGLQEEVEKWKRAMMDTRSAIMIREMVAREESCRGVAKVATQWLSEGRMLRKHARSGSQDELRGERRHNTLRLTDE